MIRVSEPGWPHRGYCCQYLGKRVMQHEPKEIVAENTPHHTHEQHERDLGAVVGE